MFLYVSFINPGLHYFFEIYLSSIINSIDNEFLQIKARIFYKIIKPS